MIDVGAGRIDRQVDGSPVAAINRVTQLQRFQQEVILCRYPRCHFLDAARAPVATRSCEFYLRNFIVEHRDEKIVAQTDLLTAHHRCNEVLTILLHAECPGCGFTVEL